MYKELRMRLVKELVEVLYKKYYNFGVGLQGNKIYNLFKEVRYLRLYFECKDRVDVEFEVFQGNIFL